jgi:hypothetical protein
MRALAILSLWVLKTGPIGIVGDTGLGGSAGESQRKLPVFPGRYIKGVSAMFLMCSGRQS